MIRLTYAFSKDEVYTQLIESCGTFQKNITAAKQYITDQHCKGVVNELIAFSILQVEDDVAN